jgi:hypothetical protein
MARESELWSWLSKARLHFKTRLHIHRIENPVSPGMPDVEGFLQGASVRRGGGISVAPGAMIRFEPEGQFWFELKTTARPAKAATPIRFKMRPKQIEWARRRWALGGKCYWLLQVGHGGTRAVYMLAGDAGSAIDKGMTEAALGKRCLMAASLFGDKITPEAIIRKAVA